MSMLRQHHHLPGLPSDASTPSGASWCAVVRHVRRGPGDSPGAADTSCRVSNGECIVQPCPAVSGRSVNGVCHAAAQILHILPQILAANRLDAQRRRANLARNKEAVDDGVAKPTTMWQQSSSLFKLQQQQSFCHTGHPQTPQAAQVATPFQGRTLLKYIWSASGKDGSTSSWDFKLPLAKQLIPDIERTCEEWRKTNTVG